MARGEQQLVGSKQLGPAPQLAALGPEATAIQCYTTRVLGTDSLGVIAAGAALRVFANKAGDCFGDTHYAVACAQELSILIAVLEYYKSV